MQVLDVQKVVGNLPSTLAPNTFYAVRVGVGYDLYLSDSMGRTAHRLNTDLSGVVVGGRNLILSSQKTVSGYIAGWASAHTVSADIAGADSLVLSVDIDIAGNTNNTYSLYNRAGINVHIIYTDGTSNWLEIFKSVDAKGRFIRTFVTPNGKTISHVASCAMHTKLHATRVIVSNPKLERGNIATDWTPAPEDTQAQIDELARRITTA